MGVRVCVYSRLLHVDTGAVCTFEAMGWRFVRAGAQEQTTRAAVDKNAQPEVDETGKVGMSYRVDGSPKIHRETANKHREGPIAVRMKNMYISSSFARIGDDRAK